MLEMTSERTAFRYFSEFTAKNSWLFSSRNYKRNLHQLQMLYIDK